MKMSNDSYMLCGLKWDNFWKKLSGGVEEEFRYPAILDKSEVVGGSLKLYENLLVNFVMILNMYKF